MLRFLITQVDVHGFLGRDHHPDPADEGRVVTAVKMESQYYHKSGYVDDVISEDGRVFNDALPLIQQNTMEEDDNQIIQMWTCVTVEGRILELLTHEIVYATSETIAHINGIRHNVGNCYHCGNHDGAL